MNFTQMLPSITASTAPATAVILEDPQLFLCYEHWWSYWKINKRSYEIELSVEITRGELLTNLSSVVMEEKSIPK